MYLNPCMHCCFLSIYNIFYLLGLVQLSKPTNLSFLVERWSIDSFLVKQRGHVDIANQIRVQGNYTCATTRNQKDVWGQRIPTLVDPANPVGSIRCFCSHRKDHITVQSFTATFFSLPWESISYRHRDGDPRDLTAKRWAMAFVYHVEKLHNGNGTWVVSAQSYWSVSWNLTKQVSASRVSKSFIPYLMHG